MQVLQQHSQAAPRARRDLQAVRRASFLAALVALSVSLTGCAAVKGIFKAGVWVGILGVVVLIALAAGGLSLFRSRSR